MNMVYRGVRYNATPAYVEVADAPVTGQYRGASVKFHQAAKLAAVRQVLHLMYRGIAFDEAVPSA